MRKLLTGIMAFFYAVILVFSVKAVSASGAIVIDGITGEVLFEKNGDRRCLPASTTKIMTALLICEQCNVLDRVRIPREAVGIEGSSMYLKEGEILTVQELLYGLMLQSGNDAAVALSIYCGGTAEGFAALMNDKAASLGLHNTHFENPNGLDGPTHFSSARDLAVLSAYAMKNPIFRQTVSTKTVRVGDRVLRNHNKLLWKLPGTEGVKTGYTKAAGRILVSSVSRQGRRQIAVTMSAPDDWKDHEYLQETGFRQMVPRKIIEKGTVLGSVSVENADEEAELTAMEDFSFSLREGEAPTFQLKIPGAVYAPAVEGQQAGTCHILLNNIPIGKIPVCFNRTVESREEPPLSWWDKIFGKQ